MAVDIGHDPGAPGATSARGAPEHAFNDSLARQLIAALQGAGFIGSFLIDPAVRPLTLADRPALAASGGAAVLLSIHHDSVQERYLSPWVHDGVAGRYDDDHAGFSLFISQAAGPLAAPTLALGRSLGQALVATGLAPTDHHAEAIAGEGRELLAPALGLYRRDTLAVLRLATVPAVLVEAGVLVNRAEELRLRDPVWQASFAQALVAGVADHCAGSQAATARSPTR